VVFQVNDGSATLISRIAVVGNKAFSEDRLSEVVNSREQRWWRFLSSSDQYDPERLNFDKELLRRFYLRNGYADIQVFDATAELAPDRKSFFVTYTLKEGALYPALHKLEATEFISSYWETQENGRERRYYAILPSGEAFLKAKKKEWNQFVAMVQAFVGPKA